MECGNETGAPPAATGNNGVAVTSADCSSGSGGGSSGSGGGGGGSGGGGCGVMFPKKLLVTCCMSPDYSEPPWKPSEGMTDLQLREEARGWDVNEEVFKVDLWNIYGKLFRADFPIFDTYVMSSQKGLSGGGLVGGVVCWFAEKDRRIKQGMLAGWQQLLLDGGESSGGGGGGKGDFEIREIVGGNHAFLYDEKLRETWMKEVVEIIAKII
eukprot:GHVS01020033.1.p1 GENE.GHVS01020033.1~~GHVS01020033.1.p1  ORF type:complete len:211 (+),score=83.44 GHVS01020033.1:574-1206(+)